MKTPSGGGCFLWAPDHRVLGAAVVSIEVYENWKRQRFSMSSGVLSNTHG